MSWTHCHTVSWGTFQWISKSLNLSLALCLLEYMPRVLILGYHILKQLQSSCSMRKSRKRKGHGPCPIDLPAALTIGYRFWWHSCENEEIPLIGWRGGIDPGGVRSATGLYLESLNGGREALCYGGMSQISKNKPACTHCLLLSRVSSFINELLWSLTIFFFFSRRTLWYWHFGPMDMVNTKK